MQQQQQQPQDPVDIFLTHVPANLRAKFGRARCRELLADRAEVQRVWNRLAPPGCHGNQLETEHDQPQEQRRRPQHLPPLQQQQQQQQQQQDWYAVLSAQFNSDYSPGVAQARRFGHNQETHGESAFEGSADFNTAGGRHKRRKDEFAAYNQIIHVERKFNNQWTRDNAHSQASSRQQRPQQASVVTKPTTTTQPPPVSILSGGGAAASKSAGAASAKRVTIREEPAAAAATAGGVGRQESLHRANTAQLAEA